MLNLIESGILLNELSIISTLCQKECYRCDISQSERIDDCAVDLEIVENSLFSTCEYLISFAGCAANLKQVLSQHTSIPKFVLDNIDENLDIDDLCPMSCQRCPAFNVNEECEDSEIFAQYDFSCSGLVAYAENGCRTQLKDLNLSKTIKQKIVKDKGIDMNTQLSVFCLKTCDVCNVQGISKEVTVSPAKCVNAMDNMNLNITCEQIIGLLSTSMSIAEACESSMSSVAKGTSYESIAQPGLAVKTLCAKECHTCGYVSCDDGFCNGDEEWIDCGGSCQPCQACNYADLKFLLRAHDLFLVTKDKPNQTIFETNQKVEIDCISGLSYTSADYYVVCKNKQWMIPPGKCVEPTVNAIKLELMISNFETNSSEFIYILYEVIHKLLSPELSDLKLYQAGTCDAFINSMMSTEHCKDEEVSAGSVTCAFLVTIGCNMNLHELAQMAGQKLPDEVPKMALVLDVCPKSCNSCKEAAIRRFEHNTKMQGSNQSLNCLKLELVSKFNENQRYPSMDQLSSQLIAKYRTTDFLNRTIQTDLIDTLKGINSESKVFIYTGGIKRSKTLSELNEEDISHMMWITNSNQAPQMFNIFNIIKLPISEYETAAKDTSSITDIKKKILGTHKNSFIVFDLNLTTILAPFIEEIETLLDNVIDFHSSLIDLILKNVSRYRFGNKYGVHLIKEDLENLAFGFDNNPECNEMFFEYKTFFEQDCSSYFILEESNVSQITNFCDKLK